MKFDTQWYRAATQQMAAASPKILWRGGMSEFVPARFFDLHDQYVNMGYNVTHLVVDRETWNCMVLQTAWVNVINPDVDEELRVQGVLCTISLLRVCSDCYYPKAQRFMRLGEAILVCIHRETGQRVHAHMQITDLEDPHA